MVEDSILNQGQTWSNKFQFDLDCDVIVFLGSLCGVVGFGVFCFAAVVVGWWGVLVCLGFLVFGF